MFKFLCRGNKFGSMLPRHECGSIVCKESITLKSLRSLLHEFFRLFFMAYANLSWVVTRCPLAVISPAGSSCRFQMLWFSFDVLRLLIFKQQLTSMFSGDCAFRKFYPLSRSRLRLHVNRENAAEIVSDHASTFTVFQSGLLKIALHHMKRGGKTKNEKIKDQINKNTRTKTRENENNVEKSDHLHCPTPKRKVRGIFLLLHFPCAI